MDANFFFLQNKKFLKFYNIYFIILYIFIHTLNKKIYGMHMT